MKTKQVKFNGNSSVNQDIKSRFVEREVLACFSYEMDAILKASMELQASKYELPTFEDIENLYEYKCPKCDETVKEGDDTQRFKCEYYKWESKDMPESTPQEIYEWWIVSEFLYDKLKTKGHPVLVWGNNWYWGRCTTGQAILLDSAITGICREMEILEGQKYSWAKGEKVNG